MKGKRTRTGLERVEGGGQDAQTPEGKATCGKAPWHAPEMWETRWANQQGLVLVGPHSSWASAGEQRG